MTKRSGLIVLCAGLLVMSARISAQERAALPDCQSEGPLRSIELGTIALPAGTASLGEWTLPISAERPDVMTHARVALDLERSHSDANLIVHLRFSFPDPLPLGIPFTFYGYELRWVEPTGVRSVVQDWTAECTEPGPSLFPHQSRDFSIEIPATVGLNAFDDFELRLWGSRN